MVIRRGVVFQSFWELSRTISHYDNMTEEHRGTFRKFYILPFFILLELDDNIAKQRKIDALKFLFLLLPPLNRLLLQKLLILLASVASQTTSKMTAYNLGVVFAPNIICIKKVCFLCENVHLKLFFFVLLHGLQCLFCMAILQGIAEFIKKKEENEKTITWKTH